MSSILKALKQLETETSDSEESSPIHPQKRSHRFSGDDRRRNWIGWMLFLVLLFFVFTGGFLLYRKAHRVDRFPPDIPSSDAKSEVTEKKIFRKIPGAISNPTEKTATAVPISENRRARKEASVTTRPKASPSQSNRRPVPIESAQSKAPVSARAPAVAKQKKDRPPAVSVPEQTVSRSPSSGFSTPDEDSSPPTFTEPNYTLQAIAWSKNPKERLAIINGKILREGQSIEDITISQIRTNEVILLKNSGRWKLSFQAR